MRAALPPLEALQHLFLPCATLALVYLAEYSLVMRASVLEEKSQDYLITARAKGLRTKHACSIPGRAMSSTKVP